MLEQLKEEVLKANKLLSSEHLAILTWGNVSGFDPEKGYTASNTRTSLPFSRSWTIGVDLTF